MKNNSTKNGLTIEYRWNDKRYLTHDNFIRLLKQFGDLLPDPLSERVDLKEYTEKWLRYADILLAFDREEIVGLRVLGKSSSLLCRYAEVKAVCSPHATKTAIALLIIGGISSQIDEMIREIDHESDIVKYERIVEKISSPEQAYKFLKESFIN